jgi:UDP-glucose 4-epimerase
MKVIITGALGHIGSYLIRDLSQSLEIDEIIIIDNFLTQRYCSLYDLPTQGCPIKFLNLDVSKDSFPANLLAKNDIVIHLAAITDATSSFDKPEAIWQNNLEGTRRVTDQVGEVGARLIFPSSTSVYGVQNQLVDENCALDALKPQSPYAECKLKEEEVVSRLIRQGSQSFICRLGTIYGTSSGMRFHTAVNKFCFQAALGLPITVWRTALHQHRPYLGLDDCCRAMRHMLTSQPNTLEAGLYNVLSGNHTVNDIVDTIREFVPGLDVQFVDSAIMNQLSYKVSAEKLKKTGFEFTSQLKVNIESTISLLSGVSYV